MSAIPEKVSEILSQFAAMTPGEHRMALIKYSHTSGQVAPLPDERFTCSSERIDEGCTDSVGVFIRDEGDSVRLCIRLGRNTQTLTRAIGHILCLGLDGGPLEALLNMPDDLSARLIGMPADGYHARKLRYMQNRIVETATEAMAARGEAVAA